MPTVTLRQFTQIVARTAFGMEARQRAGLAEAADNIAEAARGYIGEYQGSVSPFGPWPILAESTVEDRMRQGYAPHDPLLREGDLRSSIGGVVQHGDTAVVGSHNPIARYQEFGTRTIPPRSFIGRAMAQHGRDEARKVFEFMLSPLLRGR